MGFWVLLFFVSIIVTIVCFLEWLAMTVSTKAVIANYRALYKKNLLFHPDSIWRDAFPTTLCSYKIRFKKYYRQKRRGFLMALLAAAVTSIILFNKLNLT